MIQSWLPYLIDENKGRVRRGCFLNPKRLQRPSPSIDYRQSTRHTWPITMEDIKMETISVDNLLDHTRIITMEDIKMEPVFIKQEDEFNVDTALSSLFFQPIQFPDTTASICWLLGPDEELYKNIKLSAVWLRKGKDLNEGMLEKVGAWLFALQRAFFIDYWEYPWLLGASSINKSILDHHEYSWLPGVSSIIMSFSDYHEYLRFLRCSLCLLPPTCCLLPAVCCLLPTAYFHFIPLHSCLSIPLCSLQQ